MTAPRPVRAPGGARSRVVTVAKLGAPLAALALLSTVFLLADRVNPEDAIPVASVDVAARATAQQLTGPAVAGVGADGTAFRLEAAAARPDPADPRRLSADALLLRLDGAEGGLEARAGRGEIDTAARRLSLSEGVRVATTQGWRLEAEAMEGALDALDLRAAGPVRGEGPPGRLSAGALAVRAGADGAPVLHFTGGVELRYQPPIVAAP